MITTRSPSYRELTTRLAALVEEASRITDELYQADDRFSEAYDSDKLDGLRGLDMGLVRTIRDLNDSPARRDDRAEEAGHHSYQLTHEAA